ncbi:MAG: IPT/TIG domain-containing protein [Ignavibacteria bacterium]|nr:IPT/TIG domain-containing protein [Ignavibacteria bacterium]
MKKLIQYFSLVLIIASTALLSSCNQEAAPSLYQIEDKGATPAITSILPDKEALAGVTEITINGSNFSSLKENNFVYFGTAKATVLQASASQLVVKAPAKIANDLDTKIAVQGIENFSNVVKYNLLEAVGIYFAFTKAIDVPMTVATDKNENVYIYLKDKGIKKITTDGKISDYAPKGAESFFFDMKFGPNNILYGTRNLRAVFQIEEGKAGATYVTFPTGTAIVAIDFDANKNMWAAGSGGSLFSVTPAKVVTAFAIDYSVSAVRVYNGYVYVAGKKDVEEAIYRYKINSETSLGNKEKYFDIGAKYGLGKVNVGALAFSDVGDLILGTDQANALIVINSAGNASDLYTGLISPSVRSIAWGTKKNLFYIRDYSETISTGSQSINYLMRVDMQKLSAPYYGIQ